MYDYHSEMNHLKQRQQAIHNEVRHIHLANQIHRSKNAQQIKTAGGWLHVLSRLHRIRIQISFDLEEPYPEPEGAGC